MSSNLESSHDDGTSSEGSCGEGTPESGGLNILRNTKKFKIANACDVSIEIGVEGERVATTGGQKFSIGFDDVFKFQGTIPPKELQIISRVPRSKVQFHR